MNLKDYREQALQFAEYEEELYPMVALAEETGEFLGIFAKALRGDDLQKRFGTEEALREAVLKEAGDVLWQLTNALNEAGLTIEEAAELNIKKLTDRKNRGVIRGSGDSR